MHSRLLGLLLFVGLAGAAAAGCGGGDGDTSGSSQTTASTGSPQGSGGSGGEGGSSSSSTGAGGGSGGAGGSGCNNACPAVGATQCSGTVIESCAPDAEGCLDWVKLLDCATNQQLCDDGVTPAVCVNKTDPSCSDGLKNQDETDIDCGGTKCNPCGVGQDCLAASDCSSGICQGGTCQAAPTCNDNMKNQGETDVDCGGGSCPSCGVGKGCITDSDCSTGECDAGGTNVCQATPTCNDAKKNQDETDVDCGGSICQPCADGEGCGQASDCQSGTCDNGGTQTCVPAGTPTCSDGIKNQGETDVDCGGPSGCPKCVVGEGCVQGTDCVTGVCDFIDTDKCIVADPLYDTDEDFETGDYSLFPYTFAGGGVATLHPWVIETVAANCYGGDFCARTSPLHELNETSSFSVSLSVRDDTSISFWAKTNTEPNQHYFRFYIDGVKKLEISGQNDWALYTFTVPKTGANGPNRVFTWEYYRSSFVDPNHVPWNQVWVDDINMPDWNTEPTVPEHQRPWNGKLTSDPTPTFAWQSFDPDFDTIIYEMQYDTDPNFGNPVSTGEIQDTTFTPAANLMDNTLYYWRVRAKDNSNYRWSQYSKPWVVEINTTHEYGAVWRQSKKAQFDMNTNAGVVVGAETVVPTTVGFSQTLSTSIVHNGTSTLTFNPAPFAPAGTPGTLTITASGDFDSAAETAMVSLDALALATYAPGVCASSKVYPIADMGPHTADSVVNVQFSPSSSVNVGGCLNQTEQWSAKLEYMGQGTGTMVSVPIAFNLFENKKLWEKIQVIGTGTIAIQVLDEAGTLVPDAVIPGNSAGLTARTIRLWNLDPLAYPVIRLKATLSPGAALDEWSVVGNDIHEWLFSHNGDAEGWMGFDQNAMPTVTVSGGVLKLSGLAAGTDPNIRYMFPEALPASRFSTMEVRVRTSNNNTNDDPTIYWDSNFGSWDKNRSITLPGQFLFAFQDLLYNLNVMQPLPYEPFQGNLNGIRVDPAVRFYDVLNQPADGWFEIDRIAIY